MVNHTPGPWVDSKRCDAIVAASAQPIHPRDIADVGYYGGLLIAESIEPENKPLIKAAPSMLALLEKALPIIQREAVRRGEVLEEERIGMPSYWREMRELATEIAQEIDQAYGRGVKHG